MKLVIEIDLDNDAFHAGRRGFEVGTILSKLVVVFLRGGHPSAALRDSNGNKVGSVSFNN